jgi:site-specific recombinase XerD
VGACRYGALMTAGNVQRPRRTAANGAVAAAPVPPDVLADATATADAYAAHLSRTGLAEGTIGKYSSKVKAFAAWLTEQPDHEAGETFTDPFSRDYACRDYRTYLLHERRQAPATIDLAFAALDGLFTWLGLGPSTVKRVGSASTAVGGFGEHLDPTQTKTVMRAAERRGPRDLAIIGTLRFAGLRVAEVAALNTDDLWLTAGRGEVEVRGKGSKVRRIPLNASARATIRPWLAARRTNPGADGPAMWLTDAGERLAIRSIRHLVGEVGKAAGISELHPHLLRHSFARGLVDAGAPLPEIQMLLGHSSLNTTMIYARPSAAQYGQVVELGVQAW